MIMPDITCFKDVSYGVHERQELDIYLPENPEFKSGLIFFIHGGGWVEGDKSGHQSDCEYFCNKGIVSAAMNYRFVSDEITVFDELDDVTSALATLKNKLAEYGVVADKVILSGGSAGGHLSLLYAYTRKNEAPISPAAACVYCPPVDCAEPDFLMGISGEFEDWKYDVLSKCCGVKISRATLSCDNQQKALLKMSPKEYVTFDCVPTAVFQGRLDAIVPLNQVEEFVGLLCDNGVDNEILIYENSDHSLKGDPECIEKSREIIIKFAKKYLY